MRMKQIITSAFVLIGFGLGGCDWSQDSDPLIYVASAGHGGLTAYGQKWAPNGKIDISFFGEPMMDHGDVRTQTHPNAAKIEVDADGAFGIVGSPTLIPVNAICGAPPQWLSGQTVTLMARDTTHGLARFVTVSASAWFTYRPC